MENSFGEFLKQKRQEKILTQKELAKLLYVSASAVSKWEKDVAHPDITLLPKLSEVLGVTEHELITASIDKKSREEKAQAKKWRAFSMSWSLFFYISYTLALIPCFICDLAINKGLTWFWIVLSALILAFTFTNLPKLIKKNKLIFVPFSMYSALCLLLGVCCIYTHGNWFLIPALSVLFGMIVIFTPIYISKFNVFSKLKKFGDFISVGINFVALNILLIVIDLFSVLNGYTDNHWFLKIAFPITLAVYCFLNILLCVRFLKANKLIKTSIILFIIDLLYLIPPFLKFKNPELQKELAHDTNIFKANFSSWKTDVTLDNNIHCIIALSLLVLSLIFFVCGLILHYHRKKLIQKNTH
ncbi:MAG: helix-turn-helix transcriptional regulator [Clostridia bacterium]|nr:helix-turn-helix transcriptional regulator [Clostridia bacterium]